MYWSTTMESTAVPANS